jgi:spore coat polysaccharide biosynthesis protein SpsF
VPAPLLEVRAFVQARMSSRRFPGKVLAPFRGEPMVDGVVRAAAAAVGDGAVIVATSTEPSDDPLAAHLAERGISCFRGTLDDVLGRFLACADAYPCRWIHRVSADSPLLSGEVLADVLAAPRDGADIVTTVFPRAVAHGHAAELIRVDALRSLPDDELTPDDREHVTPFFYRQPERFSIVSVSPVASRAGAQLAVDTVADLRRLEEHHD